MSRKEQMEELDKALNLEPSEVDEGFAPMEIQEINDDPTVEPSAEEETADADNDEVEEAEVEVLDGEDGEDAEPAEESGESDEAVSKDDDAVEDTSEAEKALQDGSKRPSDEFGELDKDAPEKTRERFNTMKERFDEVSARVKEIEEKNNTWMETIQATGTTPEQLGKTFEYLEAVNSQDPAKMEIAYQTMMAEMQALGKILGKEAPGYDPLDEYEDIKQKVEDGYLDREDAMEIARARAQVRVREANQQQTQNSRQETDAKAEAQQQLSALGNELRAGDPTFQEKLPALQNYIKEMVKEGVNPSEWARSAKIFYRSIPDVKPERPDRTPRPNSQRPGAGATSGGGMDKEPGSALEAVDMALANMGKR